MARALPGYQVRTDLFLLVWLLLEIAGYYALTPFPAVRRVMGIAVVATLLLGRLASRTCRKRARKRLVFGAAVVSVALGSMFYLIDLREAAAQEQAVRDTTLRLEKLGGGERWYVGHWGFQFYAERAGLKPVVPGESRLHKGDWLIVPDPHIDQQALKLDSQGLELAGIFPVDDAVSLRTVMCYYCGVVPLEHHRGPRLQVSIYRVRADVVPEPE
jgi:hypothetical protein